jgi:hypothetical protein
MSCAKQIVKAWIVTKDNIIIEAENACLNTQVQCPRTKGEDYTKCITICKQQGHA